MAKTAWGIELGTSSVKAVKLNGDRGGVSLEDVSIVALSDFGLGAGTSKEDATAGALNDLRANKGIKKGDEVFVSISGQNTLGRIISLPPVAKERVRETIENEARSQIPIKLEEAVWDFQVIEDGDPDELRVNLYAAKKDVVDQLVNICDMAGLQITGIQVAPLGIYNYIKYEMDDAVSDACVAIDIGADNTDVVIIDGQKTYVRVVPVAGNDITKALRARFKLSADDAEKLKRRAHKSKDAAAVFEAMKPPLKDMVGEIYRAVGFYKSQHEDANVNQLVMMGNGSKLLNIKKFFEQQLQYQVHKVDTPVRIALARSVDPTEVQNNIQSLTVAMGLALQGLALDEVNTINLIPPEYISGQAQAKMRAPFFAAGGIAAAGGVIALLLAILSTSGVSTVVSTAESEKTSAGQRDAAVGALKPEEEAAFKAYSLRNVVEGVIGTVQPPKPDDADDDDPPPAARKLTFRADLLPGLITRAGHEAMVAYVADNPRTPVYYANFQKGTPDPAGPLTNNNTSLQVTYTPGWDGMEEGQGGYYTAQREFVYGIWIASELTSSISQDDAFSSLNNALTDKKDGLLVTRLRTAIIDQLIAEGQITEDEAKLVDFGDGLQIQVTNISNTQIGPDQIGLSNIVTTNGVTAQKDGRPVRAPRERNDVKFGVSEVRIGVKLLPVKPVSTEEEPTE
ncbi:MAG: type IV pilus assembly protein PilM [Planctomycetes bacterium]|nr:type IV pilus assembly protein PilM [Planctomycetota bacterium]